MRPSVMLFDMNETMLDMSPLKKKVNRLLGSSKGFRIWFGMLLHYSLVATSDYIKGFSGCCAQNYFNL